MKYCVAILLLFFSTFLFSQNQLIYTIELFDSAANEFVIQVDLGKKLKKNDHTFQFASTAPGTYQLMHIGRYVTDFNVYNKRGKIISSTKKSVNQYHIHKPKKAKKIVYRILETWDTQMDSLPIYPMAGSSFEKDHALISPHALIGYIPRLQDNKYNLLLKFPVSWKIGTALNLEGDYFTARSYDHLVDSPLLLGRLSYADTLIGNALVEVYTYSQNDKINSRHLLEEMHEMLRASKEFLAELPVDRYAFLYHFETNPSISSNTPGNTAYGAWEHASSSEYVFPETDPTPDFLKGVTQVASHEFFHIVTPLNIHSEKIEFFNFETPNPSQHIWFYEGITEWASQMLLYRGGVTSTEDYLNILANKVLVDRMFDPEWTLKEMGTLSYSPKGQMQWANIYNRGAMLGSLLDIALLDLSDGRAGLRELIIRLIKKYGPGKPFKEDEFFDEIVGMTYPEIRSIIDDHILDSKPLPLEKYFDKVGIEFKARNDQGRPVFKIKENLNGRQRQLFEAWSKNLDLSP